MKNFISFKTVSSTLAITLALTAFSAQAQNVAVVNGKAIPSSMLNILAAQQKNLGQEDTPELRAMLKDELINRAVIEQEAERQGLAKESEIATQMQLARQTILIRALASDFKKKNPVSAADVQKEYDQYKNGAGNKEYHARHVLVATEEEAKEVLAKIRAGKKFETLAEKSLDSGSAKNGGDLGWAAPSAYVKPFGDALTTLKVGQVTSSPVKTEFGYHVIRLEEVRDATLIPFADVKQQIEDSLIEKRLREFQAALRAKAKVE